MRLVKLCYDLELLISKGLFVSVLRKTSPRKNIPGNLPTRAKFPRKKLTDKKKLSDVTN